MRGLWFISLGLLFSANPLNFSFRTSPACWRWTQSRWLLVSIPSQSCLSPFPPPSLSHFFFNFNKPIKQIQVKLFYSLLPLDIKFSRYKKKITCTLQTLSTSTHLYEFPRNVGIILHSYSIIIQVRKFSINVSSFSSLDHFSL